MAYCLAVFPSFTNLLLSERPEGHVLSFAPQTPYLVTRVLAQLINGEPLNSMELKIGSMHLQEEVCVLADGCVGVKELCKEKS